MDSKTYHLKVGTFECVAVADGAHPPSRHIHEWFPDVPKEEIEQALGGQDAAHEAFTCLAVDTGNQLVLIDTGLGTAGGPGAGRLVRNLQTAGIEPEDVGLVVLTHGDRDHIGGNADDDGKPTFPNARYVMFEREWAFWTSDELMEEVDEERRSFLRTRLLSLRGQIDLVDEDTELVPGIRLIAAHGHRPGHAAVVVASGTEKLLYVADAIIYPFQVQHPDWLCAGDEAPEQAAVSRRQLLGWAADEKALVLVFHFPFPGLGHVVQEGEGWRWVPVGPAG